MIGGGAVELYHDGTKRFETTSTGAKITGQLNFDDGSSTANTNGIGLGSSQDARIFHDGSSLQVRNTTGPVTFITPTRFQISADSSNDTMFIAIQDGAVELYHNNLVRLETTGGGNAADGIRIRGNASNSAINLATSDANTRGTVYANSSNQIGFLNQAGNWALRVETTGITKLGSAGNGYQIRDGNVANNLYIYTAATGTSSSGISVFNGDGAWRMQLYASSSQYGFLDGNWNGWDIQKTPNGAFNVDEGSGLQRVWNAGNDGSGSGLDADLLDGSQKSEFVLNNQNSGYVLRFGSGSNSGNTSSSYAYAIFQEGGSWTTPFPDLRINYHTGIVLAAHQSYGGIRFQRDYNDTTELMSIGNGDSHVRIANQLLVSGTGRNRFDGLSTFGSSGLGLTIGASGTFHSHSVGHNASQHAGIFWHTSANYGIYREAGNWSGNYTQLRIDWPTGIKIDGGDQHGMSGVHFDSHLYPFANNTRDLGSTSLRWRNIYTNDLNLSNEDKEGGNDVDGTTGNWTIQEGHDELYVINNVTGKRYAMMLREV